MKFREWISISKNYDSLYKYSMGVLIKRGDSYPKFNLDNLEREDIIFSVIETLLLKNEEVNNSTTFIKGVVPAYLLNKLMSYTKNGDKNRLLYPKIISNNIEDNKPYEESREFLNKIKDEKLKNILDDVFYKGFEFKQIKNKYKINRMKVVYDRVKRDISNKKSYQSVHKGVARLNASNKIIKCYESIAAVAKDGFTPGKVGEICNGKGNKKGIHKGYKWCFIKNLKNEQTS